MVTFSFFFDCWCYPLHISQKSAKREVTSYLLCGFLCTLLWITLHRPQQEGEHWIGWFTSVAWCGDLWLHLVVGIFQSRQVTSLFARVPLSDWGIGTSPHFKDEQHRVHSYIPPTVHGENELSDNLVYLLSRTVNVHAFLQSLFVLRRRTGRASIFLRTHDLESLVHLVASANSSSRYDLKWVRFSKFWTLFFLASVAIWHQWNLTFNFRWRSIPYFIFCGIISAL